MTKIKHKQEYIQRVRGGGTGVTSLHYHTFCCTTLHVCDLQITYLAYFLNLAILTTDPVLRLFHVKDYSMAKITIPHLLLTV